jgi:hypothetical protein
MSDSVKNFETARTRQLRATGLNVHDDRTIGHIEQYGCSVLSVDSKCKDEPGWTYTIGVYDTCGKSDLITVGLPSETAVACLNEAVSRQRAGVDLTKERQSNLIGDVDCEFRLVDPRWVKHLMNWANWYYGGIDYPVLQAVYPDLENRFPQDEGFNLRFAQPLMQPGAAIGPVESDFWDAVEELEKFSDWKFSDPPHTGVYVSKAVQERSEPVTYVSHDADDGAWQFLGDSVAESGGVLVCLHHPIDEDQSLAELADLPLGWCAERDVRGEPWCRYERQTEGGATENMDPEAESPNEEAKS